MSYWRALQTAERCTLAAAHTEARKRREELKMDAGAAKALAAEAEAQVAV